MKRIRVNNVPDFKDSNGNWVKGFVSTDKVEYTTRAGKLWERINARCKSSGAEQKRRETYVGVTNGFKDFQEFAEWCQHQYGYMHKDKNGYFWQLDKDLKIVGNRTYSEDTCLFVPCRINVLLVSRTHDRGDWPIGVDCVDGRFRSQCRNGTGKQYLGSFNSPNEAHQAWQVFKSDLIRKIVIEDEEIRKHSELALVLVRRADEIKEDLRAGRETKLGE